MAETLDLGSDDGDLKCTENWASKMLVMVTLVSYLTG